MFLAIAPLNY